jgi:hypothetical protein
LVPESAHESGETEAGTGSEVDQEKSETKVDQIGEEGKKE